MNHNLFQVSEHTHEGGKRIMKTLIKHLRIERTNKLRSTEVFAYQFVCQNEMSVQASVLLSQLATGPIQAQILLGPL